MQKTALQICSILGLLISIAVVSASAQRQYRAHIPFDFTVNQKSYEAGTYFIDVLNADSTYKPLVLRESKGRNSHIIMMTPGGDHSRVKTATLTFNVLENRYSLTEINTPSFIAKLVRSKAAAAKETEGNKIARRTVVALSSTN